jgi:hypothetical protein
LFQGAAEIGRDAIVGTKLSIHGGLHLYSSLPERQQTFARKCLSYRDVRIGSPKNGKNRLGEIFLGRTPAKLPLASFTAIHIFASGCFDEGTACDLSRIWSDDSLLAQLNAWEPPANWRHVWKLEKRFNSEGLLLFHEKIDYCQQYIQFSERGIIEAVDHGLHSWSLHTRTIPATHWENGVLGVLQPLIKALKLIGGGIPAAICLSIRDSLEYMTVSYEPDAIKKNRDDAMSRHSMGIKDELLTMPPTILTDFQEDLEVLMQPCFDALARTGGLPGSPRYAK